MLYSAEKIKIKIKNAIKLKAGKSRVENDEGQGRLQIFQKGIRP
jgi:hypothetical protein